MKVFISGPIRGGEPGRNLRNALQAADELLNAGHHPYVPHLNIIWDLAFPHSTREWFGLNLEYLKICDVLLRLPGESEGADEEVDWAKDLGKPAFSSVKEILHLTKPKVS